MLYDKAVKLAGLALAVVLAGVLLAPAAQATPIAFYNSTSNVQGTPRFTIGCGSVNGSCVAQLEAATSTSPLAWSSSLGLVLSDLPNANPTTETNFVNALLGTSFAIGSNISPTGSNPFEFQTDGAYLLVKVGSGPTGQSYALLQNIGGGALDLWFNATGQAGGLSHYIAFGTATPTPVPEPGALGVFGLGLLILGGGYALRRRMPA
ncbi:MAG TPA: PEP-CTERM sorting domain-containing protein [Rhodanobacteraceae bacterium]|nr:PEP-CTERM sorting domain-containing protein [Rhodanobacteraceae bacterium]